MRSQYELRSREAVARCLIRRLVVPRIYFGVSWPTEDAAECDVEAIDRAGHGDAHLAQVRERAADALGEPDALLDARAPFRWIAFRRSTEDDASRLALVSNQRLYSSGAAGRVGVIEIVEMTAGDLGANIIVPAERFPGAFYDLATTFSGSHRRHSVLSRERLDERLQLVIPR